MTPHDGHRRPAGTLIKQRRFFAEGQPGADSGTHLGPTSLLQLGFGLWQQRGRQVRFRQTQLVAQLQLAVVLTLHLLDVLLPGLLQFLVQLGQLAVGAHLAGRLDSSGTAGQGDREE